MEIWLHGWTAEDHQESAASARSSGVSDLVTGPSQDDVRLAREADLDPWVCIGAFSVATEEKHLLCRSLDGHPRLWFGSGCPNHPTVRQRLLDRIRQVGTWDIAGVLLDGIRFASPFEGAETFFTCTCRWCQAAAADRGFSMDRLSSGLAALTADLSRLRSDDLSQLAAGLYAPADFLSLPLSRYHLDEWLRFRSMVILDVVAEVRAVLRATDPLKRLGAYLFTPSLAPLVGQDYRELSRDLEVISPMIYRYGEGPACLPGEIEGLAQMLPGDSLSPILRFLGLEGGRRRGQPLADGMTLDVVTRESVRARGRLGPDSHLVPILWLDDPEVAGAAAAALSGHPDGLSFFPSGDQRQARLTEATGYLSRRSRG